MQATTTEHCYCKNNQMADINSKLEINLQIINIKYVNVQFLSSHCMQ